MRLLLIGAVAVAGCRADRLSMAEVRLAVAPRLEFSRTTPGVAVSRPLEVTNLSPMAVELLLETAPPFSSPHTVRLEPGSNLIALEFLPRAVGEFSERLALDAAGSVLAVTLVGTSVEPLVCGPARACFDTRFDVQTLACVDEPLPDGAACQGRCVTRGQCRGARCEGEPVDCSDGDACTVDACDEARGCVHLPMTCQPSGPCKAARCDARLGCVEADVADGTACGPSSCDVAAICLSGACVERPRPPPTDCSGFFRCGARHCAALDIASHEQMQCVLLENGDVLCWDRAREPKPVTGLDGPARALAHGRSSYRGCASTDTGVFCWRDQVGGTYPAMATSNEGATRLGVASTDVLCALRGGALSCSGNGGWSSPVSVDGGIVDLDLGRWGDVCALDTAGRVRCWGWYQPTPGSAAVATDQLVSGLGGRPIALDYGSGKACARLEDGGVGCWGSWYGHRSLGPSFFEAVRLPLAPDRYLLDIHEQVLVIGQASQAWSVGFESRAGGAFSLETATPAPPGLTWAEVTVVETSSAGSCVLTDGGRVFCHPPLVQ